MPHSTSSKALIVSLHDVSPTTWKSCCEALRQLELMGVNRTSLLVIPNHHHQGHFLDHPDFCAWLRALNDQGHEPVIHGYFHKDSILASNNLLEKLTTRVYTASEGEFHSLPGPRARDLVSQAREEFQRIGLHPSGFIAPAWLLGTDAEAALRDLGITYTTRIDGVLDLGKNRHFPSRSLCWSVRAAWRRALSLLWNAFLFHRLENAPLLRIAIHPVDLAHSKIWHQILRILTSALRSRSVTTYDQWVRCAS